MELNSLSQESLENPEEGERVPLEAGTKGLVKRHKNEKNKWAL
jgi:hypothetical protein